MEDLWVDGKWNRRHQVLSRVFFISRLPRGTLQFIVGVEECIVGYFACFCISPNQSILELQYAIFKVIADSNL